MRANAVHQRPTKLKTRNDPNAQHHVSQNSTTIDADQPLSIHCCHVRIMHIFDLEMPFSHLRQSSLRHCTHVHCPLPTSTHTHTEHIVRFVHYAFPEFHWIEFVANVHNTIERKCGTIEFSSSRFAGVTVHDEAMWNCPIWGIVKRDIRWTTLAYILLTMPYLPSDHWPIPFNSHHELRTRSFDFEPENRKNDEKFMIHHQRNRTKWKSNKRRSKMKWMTLVHSVIASHMTQLNSFLFRKISSFNRIQFL